jgi:hypothetical protein
MSPRLRHDLQSLQWFDELMTSIIITGSKGRMGKALLPQSSQIPALVWLLAASSAFR